MDPIKNPFSPGAGAPPYELVGRDNIIEQARILFGRVKQKRPEKSLLLTGLRGVGKTVLLNEIERIANDDYSYKTTFLEAHEDKPLSVLLIPDLRRLFFELNKLAGMGDKVRRGLAVLKGFIGAVKVTWNDIEVGLDIEPEKGAADGGDIQSDLTNLFIALGEAAEERGTAVAIIIDEVQYLENKELSALIMAMHRIQQRRLPVVLVAAGLPVLPALAGDSKSYAERLFNFPIVGALSYNDAQRALHYPAQREGAEFRKDAIDEIFNITQGYPYFIQEWGYQAWNSSPVPDITLESVRKASDVVTRRLDENFFRVRLDRLTNKEKEYLRAMACLTAPYRSGDIAAKLGVKMTSLGPVRERLIKKGMIYSPIFGEMAFTVPLFDEFMKRESL